MNKCFSCYEPIESGNFHEKCSKKLFDSPIPPELDTVSSELSNYARTFIHKSLAIAGVQRKLSLHLDSKKKQRFTIVGAMGGNFILKPPSEEFAELPELEDICMHLARIVGISVSKHSLIPMADNKLAYITRRFDRNRGKKQAQEDACQLSGLLTENKYRSSHERLAKIIKTYSSFSGDDLLRLFELTLFTFITGNGDMHLKNFSLLRNTQGNYRLSPAYDLVPTRLLLSVSEDPEELALSLNGQKNRMNLRDFIQYADNLNIPKKVVDRTFEKIHKSIPDMNQMIQKSFLSDKKKAEFISLLSARLGRLS